MKRWFMLAAVALVGAACNDATRVAGPEPGEAPRHLLALAPTVKLDPVLSALLRGTLPTQRLEVVVTYDEAATTQQAVAAAVSSTGAGVIGFRHLPMVFALATPGEIAAISSVQGVKGLWSNKQLTYHLAEAVAAIRADAAHAAGYTGKGVGIAILDSGIDGLHSTDVRHPDRTVQNLKYAGNVKDLVTFGPGVPTVAAELYVENLPNSETSVGHGTHVAGIAAGNGSQSGGAYRGVAPDANLLGIGAGDILFVFWALAGFDYILEHQAAYNIQVVNNSWGGSGVFDPENPVNLATRELYRHGIAVVFAAGNEGPGENTLNSYSAAPWVISVAAGCKAVATDPTNSASHCADGRQSLLGDFSSRGIPGDPLYHPDLVAPGVHIVSARAATGTVMNGLDANHDASLCNISPLLAPYYTCSDGTSMSAPFVTGAIAVMEQAARGKLTPDQAYRALTRTARPLPGYGEWEVGAGYLDVYAAVRAVKR